MQRFAQNNLPKVIIRHSMVQVYHCPIFLSNRLMFDPETWTIRCGSCHFDWFFCKRVQVRGDLFPKLVTKKQWLEIKSSILQKIKQNEKVLVN